MPNGTEALPRSTGKGTVQGLSAKRTCPCPQRDTSPWPRSPRLQEGLRLPTRSPCSRLGPGPAGAAPLVISLHLPGGLGKRVLDIFTLLTRPRFTNEETASQIYQLHAGGTRAVMTPANADWTLAVCPALG